MSISPQTKMEYNNNDFFFEFANFLKGKGDGKYEEVDQACLSPELLQDSNCQKTVLFLYFFSDKV